jgi:hypothetical protein
MKKVFSILALAVVATAFVACGPSKEEQEAKRIADSTRVADSTAKVAAAEAAKADSIAKAAAAVDTNQAPAAPAN